ncbi:MAG: thiamine phosphate synthase [Gammaproteobacteria bacterium]|nr:thiamine phosphate synthase [Gammaproteobacteria bacterium]
MRPLPRLFAVTDHAVRRKHHLGATAAALASVGPAVALLARDPEASGSELTEFAAALLHHVRPYEAALFVTGRADVAAGLGAHGLHLGATDLTPRDARILLPHAWIGRSVHTAVEGATAVEEGADFLVAGTVYTTASHPGRPAAGLGLIETLASLGRPVIAFGGITQENVWAVKHAGAYGVAAIQALWHASRPAQTALQMLEPWM